MRVIKTQTALKPRVLFKFKKTRIMAINEMDDTTSIVSILPSCGCPTGLK